MLKHITLIAILFASLNASAEDRCQAKPGEYLIRFAPSVMDDASHAGQDMVVQNIYRSLGVTKELNRFKSVAGLVHVYAPALNQQGISSVIAQGSVKYIEPNCSRKLRVVPNDLYLSEQWGIKNGGEEGGTAGIDINATEAWNTTTGSEQVVVGIVDSGIDLEHEDLKENIWVNQGEIPGNSIDDDSNGYVDDVNGFNFVEHNSNLTDSLVSPHGTSAAGIIGAVGNNSKGIAGVVWNVKLLPLKIFTDTAGGNTSMILEAWQYAIDLKNQGVNIRVLNNSFGSHGEGPLQSEIDLVEAAGDNGIVMVFSSGNDGASNDLDDDSSNFDLDNVLTVASVDRTGALSDFSNFGAETVDIAAPGEAVLAPIPNDEYGYVFGTSFSAPFVSGVAALAFSFNDDYSPSQVRTNVINSVKKINSLVGRMVAPGIVNAASVFGDVPVCIPARKNAKQISNNDTDKDGVSDSLETDDGSNANDRGSFKQHLSSPIYTLWDGFLEMVPIVELINSSSSTITARVSLFGLSGGLESERLVNISAKGQRDIIIPELGGFQRDSYGLVKIEYCGGDLDGRTSYYKQDASGDYDFAYSIPFNIPTYGDSFVGFNTFQPSTNPAESGNRVSNWLSIVNLSSSTSAFTVYRYRDSGEFINSSRYEVAASQRVDLEGGHESVGPNNVGLLRVVPANKNRPYLGVLKRFGHDATFADRYHFAYPLQVKAGSGQRQYLPVTTTVGSQNWLEIVNTASSNTTVDLRIYDNTGNSVFSSAINLEPREQRHINVNAQLGDGRVGYASLKGNRSGSVISQSMVYLRNATSGSIEGMYGSQSSEALGNNLRGSYNLFLEMFNWLKLTNISSSQAKVVVKVRGQAGTNQREIVLPARSSVDLGLHEFDNFGTAANSFGLVEIVVPSGKKVLSELVRLRNSGGNLDFAFPTAVRDAQ